MNTIHERLAALRTSRKELQQQVAERIGVAVRTLSNWETGESEPGASSVAALASYYGVTADYLLGLAPHATPLVGDAWLVDLDLVDALRGDDPLPDQHHEGVHGWAAAIPRRHAVISSREYAALARELAPRIATVHKRRKRRL